MAISDLRQSPCDDDTPSVIPQPAKQVSVYSIYEKIKIRF